jgi:hypothetical protein
MTSRSMTTRRLLGGFVGVLAAACGGGAQGYVPHDSRSGGCGIAILPTHAGSRTLRGTVDSVTYQPDRDDVSGEPVEVKVDSGAATVSLLFWAEGRIPFDVGDRIEATTRCAANGPALARCDGTFSIDGQLALLVVGTGASDSTDGWTVQLGPRLAPYDETDEWIRADHLLILGNGDATVEVGRSPSKCQLVHAAGSTWRISGSARRTEWKSGSGPAHEGDHLRLSIARVR